MVCDAGNDLAIVDPLDQVGQDCETVQVADAVVPETTRRSRRRSSLPPIPAAPPAPAPAAPPDDRVAPRAVSLRIKGSKASGTVSLPAGVSKAQGCRGTVKLTVKAGTRTIAARTAKLSRSCIYAVRLPKSSRELKVKAVFGGNDVLSARSSPTRRA